MKRNSFGDIAKACWRAIPEHSPTATLDVFIVMPDHIHGIVVLSAPEQYRPAVGRIVRGSLGAVLRSFKAAVTIRINAARGTPGARVWQRNYFEHVVRTTDDLVRIRRYIATNPVRWNG